MAFRLALLCTLLAAAYGSPNDRVTGGVETAVEDAPWTASVIYDTYSLGGAVIVSHLHALTAASTVDDFAYANADISVRVGSSTTQSGGLLKAVENITLHPEYDEGVPNNNDIAVIRFRFRLAFGERIRAIPIAVWTGQGLPANSAFLLTGWLSPDGEEETEDLSESMQLVELRLVERAACSSVHGNVEEGETGAGQPRISQNMFCAVHFENGGNAACSGTSGSPAVLVSENVTALVGLASWFTGCGPDSAPGVYTIVSRYFPWIQSVAGARPQQYILN